MTPSAVIQPKPGIGDVIWHLPFIRAIAAAAPGGRVTFLAPPSSGAKDLLVAEPSVAEVIYFEHSGSVPMPTTEPNLPVPAATLAAVGERYQQWPRRGWSSASAAPIPT
ncbi:MAG TPA: hypothetical protein VL976_11660, partial [Xanthobacteraceae bacterium]|nr:hypothetical protein [Xanthobacteraceae bacterium]